MSIDIQDLDVQMISLSMPDAVTDDDDRDVGYVAIKGDIVAVVGTLAAGTGTTTLELNRRLPGGAKAVVGTVNVVTTGGTLMGSLANVAVSPGDVVILDVNAIGTTPTGANLWVLVRRA